MNKKLVLFLVGAFFMTGCGGGGGGGVAGRFPEVYPDPADLAPVPADLDPVPADLDPEPADVTEFVDASKATSTSVPDTCAIAIGKCVDSVADDDRGVYQHATQSADFTVQGVHVMPLPDPQHFRASLYWAKGLDDGTSSLDLGGEDALEFYGNDYYRLKAQEMGGGGTNEVLIYRLPGDVDVGAADDDDWLYGGMWLHTPAGSNEVEVIAFTDTFGEVIDDGELHALDFTATYGDDEDETPEASGYYVNAQGEASTFFADAVLEVDFVSTDNDYGSVVGTVSNDGDYRGPEFTLNLETAINAGSGEYGLYKGVTAGPLGGALIDDGWEGDWGAKFFGLYGTSVPNFVHGTFGAADTAPDAKGSILGSFLAQVDPDTVLAPPPPPPVPADLDPEPDDVTEFVDASKATSTSVPDTCAIAIGKCVDSVADDDRGVYQHATQSSDFTVQGVHVMPLPDPQHFRASLYWAKGLDDGASSLDLGGEDALEFYGNDYYRLKAQDMGGETNEVLIYRLPGDVDVGAADDDDWLYGGMWLHTPAGSNEVEVIAFTDTFGEVIDDGELHALDFTATYGAVDDETPEATGYYVNAQGEASTFFADAVLEVDFVSTDSDYGSVVGTVSNDGDYRGPEFTLNLETAINAGSGEDGLYKGLAAGQSGGALIDDGWEGDWGAKFFGLYGASVPNFVHGTFGAADTATGAKGSILGSFLAQVDPDTVLAPPPPPPVPADLDPDPDDVTEFVDASQATSTSVPDTCAVAIGKCVDSVADDDRGVYQHATQSADFTVQGVHVMPLPDPQHFRASLYWAKGLDDGTSSLDLGDEDALEFYGNDYYRLKAQDMGGETNEVLIYRLPGDVDGGAADDDDWLYGGMWLHTPAGSNEVEVIAFTDTFGEVIDDGELHALDFTATYGAVDDETPEASGYYVDEDGEASTFFADAVLEVDFVSTDNDYGNIVGTVSNDGDYRGPEFTLNLETAINAGSGEDGLYKGLAAGQSGGALIDDGWEGDWGAKFFGLYGASVPNFVHGTFGAADTATGAKGSILGSFLAQVDPDTVLAPPPAPADLDPDPADETEFADASKATSTSVPDTCAIAIGKCVDSVADDDRGVYQHATQSADFTVQGVHVMPLPDPQHFRASLYWAKGLDDGTSSLDLGGEDALEFYGNDYYRLKAQDMGGETNEVLIYRLPGDVNGGAADDDDWLYGGMWLHTPAGSNEVEVIAFTDTFGEVIDDGELHALDFTATYGADDDETPEASGYYVDAQGEASTFFADAVLEVDFVSTDNDYGNVVGTVSNDGDYRGPEFTLNLETAINAGSGEDGLYKGVTAGQSGGALIDDGWEGDWGAKFFGLYGASVPNFVHGTFGAADTAPDAKGSILGSFLAQVDPDTVLAPPPPPVPADLDPEPDDVTEFADASQETSGAMLRQCDETICADPTTDDRGVYQHATQNSNFEVHGIQVLNEGDLDVPVAVLWWSVDGGETPAGLAALFGDDPFEFYGNDYYHLKVQDMGGETNEVFMYSLSGDVDQSSTDDDTDWLYGGMWLHTPDGGDTEVIVFADAFGAPITNAELKAITDSATYGAKGGIPEASGYYVNAQGEPSTFFADVVFQISWEDGDYGSLSGEVSNDGDYRGPEFRLLLTTGSAVGTGSGAINNYWLGDWGVKIFGLDGTNAPHFVYGTFGAEDTAPGAKGSIIGSFLAQKQPPTQP